MQDFGPLARVASRHTRSHEIDMHVMTCHYDNSMLKLQPLQHASSSLRSRFNVAATLPKLVAAGAGNSAMQMSRGHASKDLEHSVETKPSDEPEGQI